MGFFLWFEAPVSMQAKSFSVYCDSNFLIQENTW